MSRPSRLRELAAGRPARYVGIALAVLLLLPIILALLLIIAFLVFHYGTYWSRVGTAEAYISQIERFKSEHGFYPDPRTQTIVPEFSPYSYGSDGQEYCVGFMILLDEDYSYCSPTRKWTEGIGQVFPWPTDSWPSTTSR